MSHHDSTLNSVAERVVEWWRERRQVLASLDELAAVDPIELAHMARDLSLNGSDLVELAGHGPGGLRLMERMAEVKGLDLELIADRLPGVLRDMQAACTRCQAKANCMHDFDEGTALEKSEAYCPNHHTMTALTRGFRRD